MSKTKKITFNMLAAGLPKIEKRIVNYGDYEIAVTPTLPIKQVVQFVDEVVETCVDVSDGTYMPEVLEMAFDCAMLHYYAGFERAKDIEKAYRVVRETNVCSLVKSVVNKEQLAEMWLAVERRIAHKLDVMSSAAATSVLKMMDQMSAVIEDSEAVMEKLQGADMQSSIAELTRLYNNLAADTHAEHGVTGMVEVKDNVVQIPRRIE